MGEHEIICIDYGKRHIGLSVSNGILIKRWGVINFKSENKALLRKEIIKRIDEVNPKIIVIGITDRTELDIKKIFNEEIFIDDKAHLRNIIIWENEDYSSKEAIGFKTKKKQRDDSIASEIILKRYLLKRNK